ncbi:MAG TPA: TPM domain-containing protein [Chthoniobacterales bacterium]|nr:TPM domain-containing protein [Chthoniobacterales bacterium]
MKCPSCATPLPAPVARCPECKLSLQRLDLKFGMVPRHSRYLSDRSGKLALPEMEEIREALRLFEKKFPQILFSVLVTELPAGSSVGEYAFWMANRARFSSVEKTRSDNFDLLLVIDVISQTAALTTGYGLEPYVREDDLRVALDALAGPLRKGDLAGGIHAALQATIRQLRELSAQARKPQPEAVEV